MTAQTQEDMSTSHILTLITPDEPGIAHTVSAGLLDVDGNITENAQFGDLGSQLFCLRTVVETPTDDSAIVADAVRQRLSDAGHASPVKLRVRQATERPRILIMVSKFDHCLVDLLYRWRNGLLQVDIPAVVSNHPDVAETAERYGIPFHHLPVSADTKAEQEAAIMSIVDEHNVDLVVLARYMQILSDDLCQRLDGRAINIHHSLLPGFKGAKPYHQAHQRGVKLVGATAHFVTAQLDEGPIIEQDVARVNHSHTAADIVELGQDTERLVLARAVRMWAEDRVLLIGDRTVIFP